MSVERQGLFHTAMIRDKSGVSADWEDGFVSAFSGGEAGWGGGGDGVSDLGAGAIVNQSV